MHPLGLHEFAETMHPLGFHVDDDHHTLRIAVEEAPQLGSDAVRNEGSRRNGERREFVVLGRFHWVTFFLEATNLPAFGD